MIVTVFGKTADMVFSMDQNVRREKKGDELWVTTMPFGLMRRQSIV